MCAKLAALRPTPVVLASVFDKYLSDGVDDRNLQEFKDLLKGWMNRDPENALPVVLQGLLDVSYGDFKGGLETIVRASQLNQFRNYALEAHQETHRLLRQEGLTEIDIFVDVVSRASLGHTSLNRSMLSALKFLARVSIENQFRRNYAEAIRLADVEFRLAKNMRMSATGLVETCYAHWRHSDSAVRLCELHLQKGDEAMAAHFAKESRRACVTQRTFMSAMKSDYRKDPINQLMREARSPKKPGSSPWDEIILTDEETDRFWSLIHKNEAQLRPQLEDQIRRGYSATVLKYLSDEERKSIEGETFPIDHFWKDRGKFYPVRFDIDSRKELLTFLSAPRFDEDNDLPYFLQERARNALIHHREAAAMDELRPLLADKETPNISARAAVVMAALGDRSDLVGEEIEGNLFQEDAACWALALVGRSKSIPSLVQALVLDMWPGRITSGWDEAVSAYFALRDLTGQDFGLDEDKWSEWAERTGNKEK